MFTQMPTGQLSAIATNQLRAWEKYAARWPIMLIWRDEDATYHLCCPVCGVTILPVSTHNKESQRYVTFTVADLLAMTVAHLRNVHRDKEGEVYGPEMD